VPTPPDLVETLELRPVSTLVNNVANNGPELAARVESVSEPADQPALF
jgi:putative SOS response-associated peptidase YedK